MANAMKEFLPDFTTIGPNTALYIPKTTSSQPQVDLLVLCTWMGAQPKHIAKYVSTYYKLLPTTRILLVQSTLREMTFRTFAQQRRNLHSAREVVRSVVSTSNTLPKDKPAPSVFLHIFSNGGSYNAVQLFESLKDEGVSVPLRGFVLDSCPGRGGYTRSIEALKLSLPRSPYILHLLGLCWIHLTVLIMIVVRAIGGRGIINLLWTGLYNEKLFSKDTPRYYLYSKGDKMVPWEEVEKHIAETERKGYPVKSIRFENSPHVGHIMEDSDKYWGAVKETLGTS